MTATEKLRKRNWKPKQLLAGASIIIAVEAKVPLHAALLRAQEKEECSNRALEVASRWLKRALYQLIQEEKRHTRNEDAPPLTCSNGHSLKIEEWDARLARKVLDRILSKTWAPPVLESKL